MRYFDFHCDTLTELYNKNLTFDNSVTHVNRYTTAGFSCYRQVFAIWSDPQYSPDEGYRRFLKITDRLEGFEIPKESMLLAVEGGGILNGKLERVEEMKKRGVYLLTLTWNGVCSVGGAFDSYDGLFEFGEKTVAECFNVGIVPDVSHASDKTFYGTVKIAEKYGKPIVASHSNSRKIFDHKRNLTDEMFRIITELGGVVGISAYPGHLSDGDCTAETVLRHIDHYMELGGEDTVCLGMDFDGIEKTPPDLRNPGELENLVAELDKRGYGEKYINKIFFDNADRFVKSKT